MNTVFITILLLILLVLAYLAYKQDQRDKAYFENTYAKQDFSEEVNLTYVQKTEESITGEEIVKIAEELSKSVQSESVAETVAEIPVEAPKKKKSRPRKKSAPKKKED